VRKIAWIAWRDFVATVTTKGFLIGLLIMPTIVGIMIVVMPRLINDAPPDVFGEVAVIDPTGRIAPPVADFLRPEAIALRRSEFRKRIEEESPEAFRKLMARSGTDVTDEMVRAALGGVPDIAVVHLDPDADLEAEKRTLYRSAEDSRDRLAIVVVHGNAVELDPGEESYGAYDLFVREKLDDRIEDEIKDGLRQAIIDARVANAGLDREMIDSLISVKRVKSTTVTEGGEKKSNQILNVLLPAAFMVLILIAVFSGGQQLMTSTIEEKSSRVVEVLLSAVSPMQLMTGKILGQLGAGTVILSVYIGLGLVALFSFAALGLLQLSLIFYLLIFYLIAYFTIGSIMASIGAAVNEMSEAQTLMTPVMLVVMIPWILWMPISRDPNSVFATVLTFIPPVNSFVVLIRLSSTAPPPLWQVWASILVGVAGVYGALWFAAKVFRIGLLMHGKPPNFATLIRWVKMA
jgi:ABC-type Na+ efflux pump permease subunit